MYTDAPAITKSMKRSQELLKLDSLTLIYPGTKEFSLSEDIRACGLLPFLERGPSFS
jgi:hypothetical protein